MTDQYKVTLRLTKHKGYTGIAILILGLKPLGYELSYEQALSLVDKMVDDGVVCNAAVDENRIDE